MNLNSYDNVADTLDKSKTWVDVKKKILLSREIKYRPYYSLIKRYNAEQHTNDYFIAVTDTPPVNKFHKPTRVDNYGRLKFRIGQIWDNTSLINLKKNCNINIVLVDKDIDGEVYHLDV